MLRELSIQNFAIIDELSFSLGPGLNIITGETGAGKSIILDALSLILGDRASPDFIRTEAPEARIEAVFEFDALSPARSETLSRAGYPEGEELLIRRSISRAGKGRVFLNESLATIGILSELSDSLVEIYGQGEHQLLLHPEYHLEFLDGYAGLIPARDEFQNLYRDFQEIRKQVEKIKTDEGERLKRLDLLSFQISEIAGADLKESDEEELAALRVRLQNSGKITSLARAALDQLDAEEGSASGKISRALSALRELSGLDPELQDYYSRLESARAEIRDLARSLEKYLDRADHNPARLEEVENRLAALHQLKRKYGGSIPEILAYRDRITVERDELTRQSETLPGLEANLSRLKKSLAAAAGKLSSDRREAGKKLKKAVISEIRDLGIPEVRFDFSWETAGAAPENPSGFADLTERGIDRVEFILSANPGEDPKPLRKVASGGELSRIMLALKKIRSRRARENPTLIFDEIDAGIGGAVAEMVGRKLWEVSRNSQVLCVTHLPQIACYADQHFLVSKSTSAGKTRARIKTLSDPERLEELSRMLAGLEITQRGKAYARELLARRTELGKK